MEDFSLYFHYHTTNHMNSQEKNPHYITFFQDLSHFLPLLRIPPKGHKACGLRGKFLAIHTFALWNAENKV